MTAAATGPQQLITPQEARRRHVVPSRTSLDLPCGATVEHFRTGAGSVSLPGETHVRVSLQLWHAGALKWDWGGGSFEAPAIDADRPLLTVVPAGCEQRWSWDGDFEAVHVSLPGTLLDEAAGRTVAVRPVLGVADAVAGPMLRLLAGGAAGTGDEATAGHLCRALASHLAAAHAEQPAAGRRAPTFTDAERQRVARFVAGKLDAGEKVTAAGLADEMNCSTRHLSRAFGASFGLPLRTFVLRERTRRARTLLRACPHLTRAAVACRCGFSDEAHLSRSLRRFG